MTILFFLKPRSRHHRGGHQVTVRRTPPPKRRKTFEIVKINNIPHAKPLGKLYAADIMQGIAKKRKQIQDEDEILILLQHLGDI